MNNMFAWLYDEDRYPSGPAGGIVTQNPDFCRRYLLLTPLPYNEINPGFSEYRSLGRTGNGVLTARYDIILDDEGNLKSYRRLTDGDQARECCGMHILKLNPLQPHRSGHI
jgi:hypothetical protein